MNPLMFCSEWSLSGGMVCCEPPQGCSACQGCLAQVNICPVGRAPSCLQQMDVTVSALQPSATSVDAIDDAEAVMVAGVRVTPAVMRTAIAGGMRCTALMMLAAMP
eukprot:3371777-Rhodomonas_salina.1